MMRSSAHKQGSTPANGVPTEFAKPQGDGGVNHPPRRLIGGVLMTDTEIHRCAQAMEKRGGGFASKLAACFYVADLGNQNKLLGAFGGLFADYYEDAKIIGQAIENGRNFESQVNFGKANMIAVLTAVIGKVNPDTLTALKAETDEHGWDKICLGTNCTGVQLKAAYDEFMRQGREMFAPADKE